MERGYGKEMEAEHVRDTKVKRMKMKKARRKMNWGLTVLAIPGFAFLAAFYYVPLIGIVIPFKQVDYAKGIWGSDWVGFKNFEFLFKSQDAFRITRNTLCLNAMFITLTLVSAIFLAILMNELTRKKIKIYQTAMFIPYFVSWVVASYVVYAMLSPDMGVIPNLMESAGKDPINFYATPKVWPVILTIAYLWKNIGYMTLLFYATLISIDSSYLEAAAIDGANRRQQVFKIMIPYMMPTIVMMALLQIGKIFYSDFGMFYFLTRNSGALYSTTDVIDTYVYRALRVTGDIGISSAAALYQSIVGFILVLVSNLIVKKRNNDYAIF